MGVTCNLGVAAKRRCADADRSQLGWSLRATPRRDSTGISCQLHVAIKIRRWQCERAMLSHENVRRMLPKKPAEKLTNICDLTGLRETCRWSHKRVKLTNKY